MSAFIYVLLLESFYFLIHVNNSGRVEGKRSKEGMRGGEKYQRRGGEQRGEVLYRLDREEEIIEMS